MVADSQISFDVINFFSLNIYSLTSLIILCCIATGYFYFCQIILYLLKPSFPLAALQAFLNPGQVKEWTESRAVFLLLITGGLGLIALKLLNITDSYNWYVLGWLLFFLFLISRPYFNFNANQNISAKLVLWLFFFSASIAILISFENTQKEFRNRLHYAELLATKSTVENNTFPNPLDPGLNG